MIGKRDPRMKASRVFNESTAAVRTPFGAFAGLMVWLLIGLFAVMCMFCVVAGAEVYRGAVRTAESNADLRTAVSYVAGKVRAWDRQGAIKVEPWEHGTALMLTEEIDGELYTTCIYGWKGGVWEVFALSGSEFDPDGGECIADGEDLNFEFVTNDLLKMTIKINGAEYTTHVALRTDPAPVFGG